MADQLTALPVRSEADGADERLHVKLVDGTTPSQRGAIDASGALSVNEAKVAGTAVSVGNGISGAGVQRVTLASDGTGVVGLNAGSNIVGSLVANQSVNEAQIAGTATAVGSGVTNAGTQRVVLATDQTPIPVTIANPLGTDVVDPGVGTAIASAAVSNHDYTVTALKTLTIGTILAAASGKMKVEVFINAVSKFVRFNSTANPNVAIDLASLGIDVAAGLVVRVQKTNLDNQAQNLYSTIVGTEV